MKANLITPAQLADRWGVEINTLSQWRWNGKGPRFLKLGKCVKYRIEDITAFEERTLYQSTSQYKQDL